LTITTNMMMENMNRYGRRYRLRAAVPQVLTGSRVAAGAAAVIMAQDGRFYAAAALITIGAVTDVLDGLLARRLGVASALGALFDTFSDYLCFIVAPWALTRALLAADGSLLQEGLIGLPLLTGALRYARNSLLIVTQDREVHELPGLATVFFAFLPVVAVFLDAKALIGEPQLSAILTFLIVVFSLLMIASVRYPKLTKVRGMTTVVLVPLVVMPFLGTRVLAGIMLVVGLLYVALAHLFVRGRQSVDAAPTEARRDSVGSEPGLLP
jgi:CDP-diacylglycerol---serine O-phosphatidyltransferase